MSSRWIGTTMVLALIGCGREPASPPPPSSKVQITAPGVKVDVDKETGKVDVVAPGANIKVNPK